MKEMVLRRIGLLLIGAPLSKHSIITEINFAPVKISHSMLQCQVITLEENFFSLGWNSAPALLVGMVAVHCHFTENDLCTYAKWVNCL